ncbi:MAG: glycosyltransferase [Planctomycetales bacterium]|nr:glycosyltransferase [Planctomycetales bacterium]
MTQDFLSIIVMAQDAEATLASQVDQLMNLLSDLDARFEVLIVDDGSQDDTAWIATELSRKYPEITICSHPMRYGEAVVTRTGLRRAHGNIVLMCDAAKPISDAALRKLWSQRNSPEFVMAGSRGSIHRADTSHQEDSESLTPSHLDKWEYQNGRDTAVPSAETNSPAVPPASAVNHRLEDSHTAPRLVMRKRIPGEAHDASAHDAYFASEQNLRRMFREARAERLQRPLEPRKVSFHNPPSV